MKPGNNWARFIFIIIVILFTMVLVSKGQSVSKCVFQSTCRKCLDADYSCAWCTDRNYDMRKSRCMTFNELKISGCKSDLIEESYEKDLEVLRNLPASDFEPEQQDAVQIYPQEVKIHLNKLKSQRIKMTYKPAKNHPLDIYYLMDLTWSMKDDKEMLVNMGHQLANTLYNLTMNYYLGFGSFADKPVMPFAQTDPKLTENPCLTIHETCEPTYSFKHRLKISNDIEVFIKNVNASDVTGNLDNLEGGLDALMQVIVCPNQIGWREKSRKIVILATDGFLHYAGDGLLAGIRTPNDKQCHLTESGEYLDSVLYDYPSLSQIDHVLRNSKINVIFAVVQNVMYHYTQVHEILEGSSNIGLLRSDSSNILQLIKDGYRDFILKAKFKDDSPEFVKIEYKTDCAGKYDKLMTLDSCDNIEIGKIFDFFIDVTLLDYPPEGTENIRIKIEESSISSESLLLNIDIRTKCECEKSQDVIEKNSQICNENGDYKCGSCACYEGWIGKTCDCDLQNYKSSKELDNQCRIPILRDEITNQTAFGPMCMDRGECLCGQCYCNFGYAGKYCQCEDCPYHLNDICEGSERGFWDCDKSQCNEGWTGERCDCSTKTSSCLAPNSDKICSGKGLCSCGRCACEPTFYGAFCEISQEGSVLCADFDPCVKCIVNRKLDLVCNDYDIVCKGKKVKDTQFVENLPISDSNTTIECLSRYKYSDDVSCDYYFTYFVDEDQHTALKIKNVECPPVNQAGIIALSAFVLTIVLGILIIIIFKVKITREDRRAFAEFEEEQKNRTKYEMESPIYKSPISKFSMPEIHESQFE